MIWLSVPTLVIAQAIDVPLLWQALQHGGAPAVALIALIGWYFERRDHKEERDLNRKLQEKVMAMAMAQVEQAQKNEEAIRAMTSILNQAFPRARIPGVDVS